MEKISKKSGQKKVLLTRNLQDFAITKLKKKYQIEIHKGKIPMPTSLLAKKIKEKEGLICFPYDNIDKNVIANAKNLKTISTFSVGFDHIDLKAAKDRKISVGFTPEVLTDATADLTLALILDASRRLTEGDRTIRKGKWHHIYGADEYVGIDLKDKKLGILGMGRIGRGVAKRAQSFGMKISYSSRTRLSKKMEKRLKIDFLKMEELFSQCDIISLHVPDTRQTRGMVNLKLLKKMKKTSFLINTSRGKIIKEQDLIAALKSKIIAGAGLDVFEIEPIPKNSPLKKLDNVVLAPHIGRSNVETRNKMAEITIENLMLGLENKKLIYEVKL